MSAGLAPAGMAASFAALAHQPAIPHKLTAGIACWEPVARRQRNDLLPMAAEKWIVNDQKRRCPRSNHGCERDADVAFVAGVDGEKLEPHCACSRLHVLQARRQIWIGWIEEHGDKVRLGHHLAQKRQSPR